MEEDMRREEACHRGKGPERAKKVGGGDVRTEETTEDRGKKRGSQVLHNKKTTNGVITFSINSIFGRQSV